MKIAITARVSTANYGQDVVFRSALRKCPDRRGWTVADKHVDVRILGTTEERPELDG
jgi:hypothetical protein